MISSDVVGAIDSGLATTGGNSSGRKHQPAASGCVVVHGRGSPVASRGAIDGSGMSRRSAAGFSAPGQRLLTAATAALSESCALAAVALSFESFTNPPPKRFVIIRGRLSCRGGGLCRLRVIPSPDLLLGGAEPASPSSPQGLDEPLPAAMTGRSVRAAPAWPLPKGKRHEIFYAR